MKLSKNLITLIIITLSSYGYSQTKKEINTITKPQAIEFVNQIGGESKDKGLSIVADDYGNVITVGVFSNTIQLETVQLDDVDEYTIKTPITLTAKGKKDGIISKYDSAGKLNWVTQLSATSYLKANVIDVNVAGWIYVAGTFKGDFTYSVDGTNKTITSKGQDGDAFILQMSKKGKVEWVRHFGGTESTLNFTGLKMGSDNSIFLAGNFNGKTNFNTSKNWAEKQPEFLTSGGIEVPSNNGFLLKLNYVAEFKWVKQISSSFDSFTTSMEVDNDNNIYVSGTFQENVTFAEGKDLSVIAGTDSYISKYNKDGDIVWVKSFGAIGDEKITSIALNNENKLIVSGDFKSELDDDEEHPESLFISMKTNGTTNGFVFSLDTEGKIEWHKHIDNELNIYIQAVNTYSNGDIIVVAYIKNEFSRHLYTVKLNNSGNSINESTLKGSYVQPNHVVVNPEDDYAYVIGQFKEKIVLNTSEYSSKGRTDIFLIKLK